MRISPRLSFVLLAFVVTGCQKLVDKTTYSPTNKDAQAPYVPVPESEMSNDKATLGHAGTTYCRPAEDGTYPSDTKIAGGETSDNANGTYHWGEGGGCIARPILETWATSMNQGLMVWTEDGNSGRYAMPPPPAGVTRFFDVEYTHVEKGIGIKVKWNMTWYHTVLRGTLAAPEQILINYRRYMGTKYIKYWEGSIVLTKLAEGVTSIFVRNQIRAARVTEVNAKGAVTDIVSKLRTGVPNTGLLP